MTDSNIHIFEDKSQVAREAAEKIKELSSGEKRVNIALSGGSTPRILFELLAKEYNATLKWENLHFYWGDERCVEPTDEDSNFLMTKKALLDKVPIPDSNIHRIRGENEPGKESIRYAKELSELPAEGGFPVFDLILLGMGEDGHTASIFPHQIELMNSDKACEVAMHPVTGQKRITLTGGVINRARHVIFLVTGMGKADRVREIFSKEPGYIEYPAAHIKPEDGHLDWYLDQEAASKL